MKQNKCIKKVPYLNYDGSWKYALSIWLNPAIKFFLPNIYKLIDWNKEHIYLEEGLHKNSPADKKRMIDKLIQFNLLNETKILLLLHIEIQSYLPKSIAERMFNYGIKIINKYRNHKFVSFILYIGLDECQNIHIYQPFQFSKSIHYIGEYYVLAEHSEEELMNSDSIIGYALLLTLWINKQKKHGGNRIYVLKRYIEFINSKKKSKNELAKLFQFVELLVTLPKELNEEYQQIKNQQINYMANIVVTPERERAFQETISYLISTKKTKEDILLEGKLEGERIGLQKGEFKKAYETAKSLKNQGVSIQIIAQATGLAIQEIQNL
ncbi:MAG: Rpn family recombination-promoting nuclease/putative transposase [Sediminibacterium sp.]|nr:Rpn family recombination-promoting nuclease/putative transposase [Sediminibacterium sp.]